MTILAKRVSCGVACAILLAAGITALLPAAPAFGGPARQQRARMASTNFGFEKVERLPGNIGYLDLRGFVPPEMGEETAAAIFAGACAGCHLGAAAVAPPHGIDFRLGTAISAPDPRNTILIVLDGIRPPQGQPGPWMPRFDGAFTDAQLAALLGYLRAHYSAAPAWTDLETRVRDIRHSRERP